MEHTLSDTERQCHEWAERGLEYATLADAKRHAPRREFWHYYDSARDLANRIIAARTAQAQTQAHDDASDAWAAEAAYVAHTARSRDWSSFNGDPEGFARYVRMQIRHCESRGFFASGSVMRAALKELTFPAQEVQS